MLIEIPTRNDLPAYSQRIDLGETTFNMTIRYNERAGLWFLDLFDADDNQLIGGLPMLTGIPLLQNYKLVGRPKGDLVLFDRDGKNINAKREDLGDLVRLYYYEAGQ